MFDLCMIKYYLANKIRNSNSAEKTILRHTSLCTNSCAVSHDLGDRGFERKKIENPRLLWKLVQLSDFLLL